MDHVIKDQKDELNDNEKLLTDFLRMYQKLGLLVEEDEERSSRVCLLDDGDMNKILSFVVNNKNELLILKGSPNDPQFKKSLWYVVTGGCEEFDDDIESTVIREIKEETDLDVIETFYLNWIFKYKSLGNDCTEYAYVSFVNDAQIRLNEESIEYRWCTIDEFIKMIDWYGDKRVLRKVLEKAMKKEKIWNCEKIEVSDTFLYKIVNKHRKKSKISI